MNNRNKILIILFLGLTLRLILLGYFWEKELMIVDETHYQAIAENIMDNKEFALEKGVPTSMRPPLYPFLLSTIYYLTGGIHFNAVRIVQIILSLAIIYVVYVLGKKIFNENVGLVAALIFAVYPSFLFFTNLLLTEVVFTFLFVLFVWFFISFLEQRRSRDIWMTGVFMGLCALTRSILYPFLAVAIIFLFFTCKGSFLNKAKWLTLLAVGYFIVVGPWSVRNTILHKTPVIVNTMGGYNLYMGNYEHTPLNSSWAAVGLTGDKSWYYGHKNKLSGMNEAQKEKWCKERAKEFILEHKLLTVKRDLIKAANFWGMERAIIGGIIAGHYPELNRILYLVCVTLTIFFTFAMVTICFVFGCIYNIRNRKSDIIFIVLLICYFTAMHSIVFGHPRYHLPLIPLLAIFAAWSILNYKKIWERRSLRSFKISVILSAVFIIIWAREILFVEGARYLSNMS